MKILAFDIGCTAIKLGVFDEKGNIFENKEYPTNLQEGGQKLMGRILELINEYKDIDRIGVSATGQINTEKGSVIYGTDRFPDWRGMQIKDLIEKETALPVVVENDANAAALGEAYYGSGIGISDFLCITYGTGIGGAIIESGRVNRGSSGSAAEFGHMITHAGGKKCLCGGEGCYEVYASTSVLCENAAAALKYDGINGREIFRLLMKNNAAVKTVVDKWIDEIVIGLVSLVYIFNPSCIILGGGIMSEQYILDYIRESLPKRVMPSFRGISLRRALMGNLAGLYGAMHSALCIER